MPHIHTGSNEHDFTVSAFIVHPKESRLLLHRHKKLGILIQPGGHVELAEHPWETMTHELEEETGYELSQLKVLQAREPISGMVEQVHPVPLALRTHDFPGEEPAHFHTDMAFGFVTDELPLGKPGEDESDELFWLTAEEIRAIPEGDIPPDARTIALHVLKYHGSYVAINAAEFTH